MPRYSRRSRSSMPSFQPPLEELPVERCDERPEPLAEPMELVDSLNHADGATRPSMLSSLWGRKAVLRTWLLSSPFVTSAFEDVEKGTAKKTRMNTLYNRYTAPVTTPQLESKCSSPSASSASLPRIPSTCSGSSCTSACSARSVCFLNTVEAVYPDAQVDEEELKPPTKRPPLEVRLSRARMQYPTDPSQPISSAAKWMQQRSTS